MDDILPHRVLPALGSDTEFFWTSGQDGRLRFQRCTDCGYYIHPPTGRCPECLGTAVRPDPVSGRATVYSYTVNHQQWLPGSEPYVIAVVDLPEQAGLRLTTNLLGVEPDEVTIGMPVEVEFLQREDVWLPLFRAVGS